MSTIAVCLVAWPKYPWRVSSFIDTVERLQRGLSASSHAITYVCSAEHDGVKDPAAFADVCQRLSVRCDWRRGPANLGGNMNAALAAADDCDYLLLCQEDMKLIEPLDLQPSLDLLANHPDIALVRYGWARTEFAGAREGFNLVRMDGPEPYQDEPSLRRASFPAEFGWYLEGGPHGSASADMMSRLRDAGWQIAATQQRHFSHCGEHRTPSCIPDRWRESEREELQRIIG